MVDETLNNDIPAEEAEDTPQEVNDQVVEPDQETEGKDEEVLSPEQEEINVLKAQIAQDEAVITELRERMLRIQADFENFRKRTQREKEDLAQYTKENFITKLLPVLDNFDLAIDHSSTDNMEAYRKGVELVAKQLKDVLEDEGLKEIQAINEAFDPNYHHGVAVDQNPEVGDQVVTEVFQKGYQLKNKVLRPSMVKVNQN